MIFASEVRELLQNIVLQQTEVALLIVRGYHRVQLLVSKPARLARFRDAYRTTGIYHVMLRPTEASWGEADDNSHWIVHGGGSVAVPRHINSAGEYTTGSTLDPKEKTRAAGGCSGPCLSLAPRGKGGVDSSPFSLPLSFGPSPQPFPLPRFALAHSRPRTYEYDVRPSIHRFIGSIIDHLSLHPSTPFRARQGQRTAATSSGVQDKGRTKAPTNRRSPPPGYHRYQEARPMSRR